jgi:hypothetical protein
MGWRQTSELRLGEGPSENTGGASASVKPAATIARRLAREGARRATTLSGRSERRPSRWAKWHRARRTVRRCPSDRARVSGRRARVTGADRPSFFENGRRSFRRRRGGARAQRVNVVVGRKMAAFRERRSERRGPKHIAVAKPSRLGTALDLPTAEALRGRRRDEIRPVPKCAEGVAARAVEKRSESIDSLRNRVFSGVSVTGSLGNERALSAVREACASASGVLAASRTSDRRTRR